MSFSFYISKRITSENSGTFSSTISKIAVASIAFGLVSVLLAFMILGGFQKTIKDKIYSFTGHLLITKYTLGLSYEEQPISTQSEFYKNRDIYEFIDHTQNYAIKAGLLRTDKEVQGVVLKGVDRDYDSMRFSPNIKAGRFINFDNKGSGNYSSEIVVSKKILNQMNLSLGEQAILYFVQNPPRYRQVTVVGIYETGLEDFDDKIILGDLGLVQRINNWSDTLVGGHEVFLKNSDFAQNAEDILFETIDYDLYVDKVSDKYIQTFDWLALLDRNVVLFLVLILFVASFNMISITIILIMERTHMIGMLKALGADNKLIRKIFVFNGMLLIVRGLIIGNLATLFLAGIQYYFHLIPLDPKNYYMEFVPILWDIKAIFFVNILTFLIVSLTLIIPTLIIEKISPIEAIKFNG